MPPRQEKNKPPHKIDRTPLEKKAAALGLDVEQIKKKSAGEIKITYLQRKRFTDLYQTKEPSQLILESLRQFGVVSKEALDVFVGFQDSKSRLDTRKALQQLLPIEISIQVNELLGTEELNYLTKLRVDNEPAFRHSIKLIALMTEKFEEFAPDLEHEGVPPATMLRACALHDIGKLLIPNYIWNDQTSWAEFKQMALQLKHANSPFVAQRLAGLGLLNDRSLEQFTDEEFANKKINCRDLVPLSFLFKDKPRILEHLKSLGVKPEETSFMDMIRPHEQYSRAMIENMEQVDDHAEIAELVGAHHGYERHNNQDNQTVAVKKPVTLSQFRLAVTANELVHLVDVHHALSEKRTYKDKMPMIDVLHILVQDAQAGVFIPQVAARWVQHSLRKMPAAEKNPADAKFQEITQFCTAQLGEED